MRTRIFPLVLLILAGGCGKTAEQKSDEERLNADVMQLHERQMEEMMEIQDLISGIDIELAHHDRLALRHPKEMSAGTADDLINARKMLLAAKGAMTAWMKGYRPYGPSMQHDTAMASLASDKNSLLAIQASVDAARNAATTALESHRKLSDRLTSAQTRKDQ